MSRIRVSDQLRALQQTHATLVASLSDLQKQRRVLLLRQGLLNAWCDSMTFVQLSLAMEQPEPAVDEEAAKFSALLEREVQLLKKLSGGNGALNGCHPGEGSPGTPKVNALALEQLLVAEKTISPASSPMTYLHRFISQPPPPDTYTMTAEQMAALIQQTTQRVSIKLHILESLAPWDRDGMVEQLGEAWDRYMLYMRSLVMVGRQDIVEKALTFNLETMQPEPAAAASHQAAQAASCMPLLGLSEQQQEFIAVGMGLYFDILHSIHQERQQLNSQMTAAAAEAEAAAAVERQESGSRSAGDTLDISSPTCSSSSSDHITLPDRQEQLQRQQQLTSRLNLLLHKEYKLRLSAMGWFIGALSYQQLSKLAVLSWPYGMRVLFLGNEIMQHHEKQAKLRVQMTL